MTAYTQVAVFLEYLNSFFEVQNFNIQLNGVFILK